MDPLQTLLDMFPHEVALEGVLDDACLFFLILPPFLEQTVQFEPHIHLHIDLRIAVQYDLSIQAGEDTGNDLPSQPLHIGVHGHMSPQRDSSINQVQFMVPRVEAKVLIPDGVAVFPDLHALQYTQVTNLQQHVTVEEVVLPLDFITLDAANEMNITTQQLFH